MSALPPQRPRRDVLRLLGVGALGAALAACGTSSPDGPAVVIAPLAPPPPGLPSAPVASLDPPPPVPRKVFPAGVDHWQLLDGTPWATPVWARHSGLPGPGVLVLGGVHGNEPGGWLAAEVIAGWEPLAGSLVVVPRANIVATHAFQRTLPDLGDLNRSYPGASNHPSPMGRMANAIIELTRWFEIDLALDLHESWAFFADRSPTNTGTAWLGQTVTKGTGPIPLVEVESAVEAVNARVTERERFFLRDGLRLPAPTTATPPPTGTPSGRSSSSLSLGTHNPGVTPILIEMGQMGQSEARRRDLHLDLVYELLTRRGVV